MTIHYHISEIDKTQWDALVEQSPTASFFQTRECYEFYEALSFMKPFVVGVSENEKLVGVLCGYVIAEENSIKRFFSERAIVPGGLLLDVATSSEAICVLLNAVKKTMSRRAIYLEIRNYNDFSVHRSTIESNGFSYLPHLNYQIEISNPKTALGALSDSKRRQLKTSQKAGVEWVETSNRLDVSVFYHKLKSLYDSKLKIPLFPLEFFEKLVELPSGKLLVVKHNGEIVGGMACVGLQGKVLYEWFVCGDDSNGKNMYASVVATWAGIEYAARNNYKRFDFMGAGKPDKKYGVREFKSKFGGELVEQGRFLYICKPLLYSIGSKYISLITNR